MCLGRFRHRRGVSGDELTMEERLDQAPLAIVELSFTGDQTLTEDPGNVDRAPFDEGLLVGGNHSLHELRRGDQTPPLSPEVEVNQGALAAQLGQHPQRVADKCDGGANGGCEPGGPQRLTSTR
jgi:hypothetical protein